MSKESDHLERLHTESPYSSICSSWQHGVAQLRPTKAQLEHGLELHLSSHAVDHFGFLPSIHSPELASAWTRLREGQIGGLEYHFELSLLRQKAGVGSSNAMAEFLYALAASGLSGIIQTSAEGKDLNQDLKRIASFRGIERRSRGGVVTAGSVEELDKAARQQQFAMVLSVNGPPCAGHLMDPRDEFQWLEAWSDLGVRLMHLTYNRRNLVGDGCSEPANAGLSDLGRELVGRLNDLGIIVDVPHSGSQTCLDACAVSRKPIMASHTGRKAFHNHLRTKSDEVLKAIAGTDGLIGVVSLPSILGGEGNLAMLLDAVEDMTHLVGVDHVAIATDYAYASERPAEFSQGALKGAEFNPAWWGNTKPGTFSSSSKEHFGGSLQWTNWPLFTTGLVMRGFSDNDIAKILSGNFRRILAANGNP